MEYRSVTYKAERAGVPKDGKQVRIVKTVEDAFAPERDEQITVLDWEDAKDLRDSLNSVLK